MCAGSTPTMLGILAVSTYRINSQIRWRSQCFPDKCGHANGTHGIKHKICTIVTLFSFAPCLRSTFSSNYLPVEPSRLAQARCAPKCPIPAAGFNLSPRSIRPIRCQKAGLTRALEEGGGPREIPCNIWVRLPEDRCKHPESPEHTLRRCQDCDHP